MMEFFGLLADLFSGIFDKLMSAYIYYGDGYYEYTSVGSILFAALVIGFVASLFWKGAKAQ